MSFLDRAPSIAPVHYNRGLIAPAAFAIHLAIGQVYAFSVFKNPLIDAFKPFLGGDNLNKDIGYIFAIAFLGISAAIFGAWLEQASPRRAMLHAAICFGAGFSSPPPASPRISYGLCISLRCRRRSHHWRSARQSADNALPRKRSGRWTRHRSHHARHGAALSCLHDLWRLHHPRSPPRLEAGKLQDAGQPHRQDVGLITSHNVAVAQAWEDAAVLAAVIILFTNVTAGIGILEEAAPMIHDFFKGHAGPSAAVGFVGLLSILNMAGRFLWASL